MMCVGVESCFLLYFALALSTFCEALGNHFLVTGDIFLQKEITNQGWEHKDLEERKADGVIIGFRQVASEAGKKPASQRNADGIAHGPEQAAESDYCAAMFRQIDISNHRGPIGWIGRLERNGRKGNHKSQNDPPVVKEGVENGRYQFPEAGRFWQT